MAASSGSSNFDETTAKLIKLAGCLRAKYRVGHPTLMPLQCLGIHQKTDPVCSLNGTAARTS